MTFRKSDISVEITPSNLVPDLCSDFASDHCFYSLYIADRPLHSSLFVWCRRIISVTSTLNNFHPGSSAFLSSASYISEIPVIGVHKLEPATFCFVQPKSFMMHSNHDFPCKQLLHALLSYTRQNLATIISAPVVNGKEFQIPIYLSQILSKHFRRYGSTLYIGTIPEIIYHTVSLFCELIGFLTIIKTINPRVAPRQL